MLDFSKMPSRGVDMIFEERTRQINDKGYKPEGDVGRADELTQAAFSYLDKVLSEFNNYSIDEPPPDWPWDPKHWKPEESEVENLVKAGALIAAAIDALWIETVNG